jgi:hypothetical protein
MRNWINYAQNLSKIAKDSNLSNKKVAAKEIFGSNLFLASRAVAGEPQNQWAALGTDHQMAFEKSESQILERVTGIEPVSSPCPSSAVADERETGVEPAYPAWKAGALPLCYSR